MCEEQIPTSEMGKLEIGPVIPQIKLIDSKLPVLLNPFYNKTVEQFCGVDETEVIFGGINCSCRMRRRSESILDECKKTSTNQSFPRIEHSIKNPTQLKRRNKKKGILRDPVLMSLQKCLHPKHLKAFGDIPRLTKKITGNVTNTGRVSNNLNKSCSTVQALDIEDTISSLSINSGESSISLGKASSSGISDFRELIVECQSLLETNFSFDSWNTSVASRKNHKHFKMIQSIENRSQKTRHFSENRKARNEDFKREETGMQCGFNSGSTSCSQQARINASTVGARNRSSIAADASTPCDVTIDELASYFETFVHIPKKMSSMAEMMYI